MPGPALAQDAPQQDSPTQAWIVDWVDFLIEMLPLILLVVVILVGILLVAKAQSGIGRVIGFGLGAALVYLLLTNLEQVADYLGDEFPIEDTGPEEPDENGSGQDGSDQDGSGGG